jgi:excisionase family DNA binding protein
MSPDRRDPTQVDRRKLLLRPGGRRATDRPTGNGWTTGQLAHHIGMSRGFVLSEIKAREIIASQFGREWRIAAAEVRRYLESKGFPLPDSIVL